MKRILLAMLFLAFATALFAQTKPHIQFSNNQIDLGTLPLGKKNVNTIRFTNTGKQALVVSKVSAECKFLSVASSPKSVSPGQSGAVTITLLSTTAGTFGCSVIVNSNSDDGEITLLVTGKVVAAAAPPATGH